MGALVPVVGRRGVWCRDFALIGAVCGALAPSVMALMVPTFALAAAAAGAASGAVLGWILPAVLERARGRIPLAALGLLALPVGAVWGGFAGAFGGLAVAGGGEAVLIGGIPAAIAGSALLGLLWLPYTVLAVTRRATWPLVVASAVAAPIAGTAALLALAALG